MINKYRLNIGKKECTSFMYRNSIPTNPVSGTFYWVEEESGSKLFFADENCILKRLDFNFITESDLDEALKTKINKLINEDDLETKLRDKINRRITKYDLENALCDWVYRKLGDSDLDDELYNFVHRKIDEVDLTDELKDYINRIISESDLDDELVDKINNISIDEENKLMTVTINGKDFYTTIFAGVNSPILSSQSSIENSTSDSVTKSIKQNETDATTKWIVSKTELTPVQSDYSSWNTGTTITINDIFSDLNTTFYAYAVNLKNGLYSPLSSQTYKFRRMQIAPSISYTGNNYSTSRSFTLGALSEGFKYQFSADNNTWYDDLKSAIGTETFSNPKEKTYTFYIKYINETTTEYSDVKKTSVTVSSPQIATKSFADIPESVTSFDGWTLTGVQTMNETKTFNETFDYYPCFAVPSGKSFVAKSLGKELPIEKSFSATIPTSGNSYKIYVLPKQTSNVDAEMDITIK